MTAQVGPLLMHFSVLLPERFGPLSKLSPIAEELGMATEAYFTPIHTLITAALSKIFSRTGFYIYIIVLGLLTYFFT